MCSYCNDSGVVISGVFGEEVPCEHCYIQAEIDSLNKTIDNLKKSLKKTEKDKYDALEELRIKKEDYIRDRRQHQSQYKRLKDKIKELEDKLECSLIIEKKSKTNQ